MQISNLLSTNIFMTSGHKLGKVPANCNVPIRTNAFRIVHRPPLANVPAQRTRRTNAFVAARVTRLRCGLLPNCYGHLLLLCCTVVKKLSRGLPGSDVVRAVQVAEVNNTVVD